MGYQYHNGDLQNSPEMITFLFLLTFVSLSLHGMVLALMILSIIFLFWFNKHRDSGIFKIILLSAILFTLLNSFWIIPYLTAKDTEVAKIYQTDDIENIGEKVKVGYKTISPVRFQTERTDRKYLVFTEPYSKDWKLDGKEPVKAYGAVNAFENGGKEIRFERFYRVNLPAYIISILAFVGTIAVYLSKSRRRMKVPK